MKTNKTKDDKLEYVTWCPLCSEEISLGTDVLKLPSRHDSVFCPCCMNEFHVSLKQNKHQ